MLAGSPRVPTTTHFADVPQRAQRPVIISAGVPDYGVASFALGYSTYRVIIIAGCRLPHELCPSSGSSTSRVRTRRCHSVSSFAQGCPALMHSITLERFADSVSLRHFSIGRTGRPCEHAFNYRYYISSVVVVVVVVVFFFLLFLLFHGRKNKDIFVAWDYRVPDGGRGEGGNHYRDNMKYAKEMCKTNETHRYINYVALFFFFFFSFVLFCHEYRKIVIQRETMLPPVVKRLKNRARNTITNKLRIHSARKESRKKRVSRRYAKRIFLDSFTCPSV